MPENQRGDRQYGSLSPAAGQTVYISDAISHINVVKSCTEERSTWKVKGHLGGNGDIVYKTRVFTEDLSIVFCRVEPGWDSRNRCVQCGRV